MPETIQHEENKQVNLEDDFQNLFSQSMSGSGEEELLRIASKYSRQLGIKQIKHILLWKTIAWKAKNKKTCDLMLKVIDEYLDLKQFNGSDVYVMKALEFIALRKFINENTLKLNMDR